MKRQVLIAATVFLALQVFTPQSAGAATPLTFGVIGDIPYGSSQFAGFPARIAQLNADPSVQLVAHLGDISSPINCSSSYYSSIKADFDRFVDPLIYTPGDNEWADCSRASIGAANPIDRLKAVRATFYPHVGQSMGQSKIAVTAQSGYPENVRFASGGLVFVALDIAGSNNDLALWKGQTAITSAQSAEFQARVGADVAQVKSAFAQAKSAGSRAVVIFTQADMFAAGASGSTYRTAFQSIVKAIAAESAAFGKPVFLFNGDTHAFVTDKPLTSPTWRSYYGIGAAVPNLSRVTIEGGSGVDEWVKVTVITGSAVLQVSRVHFS
jgi:hypothetical protein